MSIKSVFAAGLLLALAVAPAEARKWTVTERQQKLSAEINSAYRANQLTLAEAEGLRRQCDKVSEQEKKMKEKNGGKLSYADDTSLERTLNKISVKLHKQMLEKRVQ